MADVYEKDLAQKTSLTTSDYIRVVGSDNVSYKQQVSNVKDAFGVAVYHIEYAETASTSGTRYYSPSISGAIDSIATKGSGRYMVECIRNTSYSDTYNNITSSNMTFIVDVLGASYINVIGIQLSNDTSAGDKILKRAKSPTWGDWIKMPTRAEVDALTNSTASHSLSSSASVTITLSKYQCAGILYGAIGNALGFAYSFGNGYLAPIKTATNVSVTLGSDYKTITVTNSSSANGWVGMSVTNGATVTMS